MAADWIRCGFGMESVHKLGGRFTFQGTGRGVHRVGVGLAGDERSSPQPAQTENVLREALALGIDHIRVRDGYGVSSSSEPVRTALGPGAKNVVFNVQVGVRRGLDEVRLAAHAPSELRANVHESLRQLGCKTLDVVTLRCAGATPSEGSLDRPLAVLLELKREGQIQSIGLANVTPLQVRQARAMTDIVCVCNRYDLLNREDDALIDTLAQQAIAYVPDLPLGEDELLSHPTLAHVARELGATPKQVVFAWLLKRAPNLLLVPHASNVADLHENVACVSLVLPPECVTRLDALALRR